MDVDDTTFYTTLPHILNDVRESIFVALDLELSGVPIKQSRVPGQSYGKQTIQQRYSEVKAAAEKYQILQIGLTFTHHDPDSGKYVCKPYNIPISPLIQDNGLDIERSITFSSGAATFLRSVYFDFSKPFNDGVSYLTNDEIDLAKAQFVARQKRAGKTTLDVKESDTEAMAYLESVRLNIKQWLSSNAKHKDNFLNVGPPTFHTPGTFIQPEMTKYQKWLVHQLIQAEFSELRTVSRRGFIQIVHFDASDEARKLNERQAEFEIRIARQKGFGWVIDALLGRKLRMEPLLQSTYETEISQNENEDRHMARVATQEACDRLLQRPSTIVGHNCFLDLVYIYHTFIGSLPDSVQDFASKLHEHFPLVIDTKYMATHNCGDIPPHSSLEELARQLEPRDGVATLDMIHPGHDKYENTDFDFFHEAGFDSLLTAQVAVRLSRQLEARGKYVEEPEDGGVMLPTSDKQRSNVVAKVVDKSVNAMSATLSSLGLNTTKKSSMPANDGTPGGNEVTTGTAHDLSNVSTRPTTAAGIPSFNSDFWRVYGNHLRVFGTQEGVLSLEAFENEL